MTRATSCEFKLVETRTNALSTLNQRRLTSSTRDQLLRVFWLKSNVQLPEFAASEIVKSQGFEFFSFNVTSGTHPSRTGRNCRWRLPSLRGDAGAHPRSLLGAALGSKSVYGPKLFDLSELRLNSGRNARSTRRL